VFWFGTRRVLEEDRKVRKYGTGTEEMKIRGDATLSAELFETPESSPDIGWEQVMQRMEESADLGGTGRMQTETQVEQLAGVGVRGESVAEVAHDARNMVTALGLYCDLLEEPGVLAAPFLHYGNELRLVAAASRRLVEKLASMEGRRDTARVTGRNVNRHTAANSEAAVPQGSAARTHGLAASVTPSKQASTGNAAGSGWMEGKRRETPSRWDLMPATPIENMAAELLANHNLLAALAGPTISLTVDVERGARPVRLTGEDLTRVLVNLVKNAAEAMPGGGRIQLGLCELPAAEGATETLSLTIEDDGPGVPEGSLEEIFTSGFSMRTNGTQPRGNWTVIHRGLGLSITRSIVEEAGGRIVASNRARGGACFAIELPVRKGH
jgi:signal transduction histidine kinase